MRDYYRICMDTETIEERSLADLQEILTRLGGWAVVEGEDWEGEEGFLWHELSVRAAQEGFDTSRILLSEFLRSVEIPESVAVMFD